MNKEKQRYQPIENYGVIGDMKTIALVSLEGSIDFMSFPRFDSPTIFASLLDADKGGSFSITPQLDEFNSRQLYIPGTAVLLTRFFAEEGIAEIIDYMPVTAKNDGQISAIVRCLKTIRGNITFRINFSPRFDYAMAEHEVERKSNSELNFVSINDGNTRLRLIAGFDLDINDNDGYAEITLRESEDAMIVMESVNVGDEQALRSLDYYTHYSYQETIAEWRGWLNKTTYKGRYSDIVYRSAITLRLLTSAQYGSVIAAATFGLPETQGGNRNWDYRFTWIRDAAFSMYAFLRLGMFDEATRFLTWIFNLCQENALQLLYALDGNHSPEETVLEHLEGYNQSKPVRIGNAAASQTQLDIFGELIDTVYIYNKSYKPITYEFWNMIELQIAHVVKHWRDADHGIWEIRNEKKEFLHTRLMCWVAVDRGIKIAEYRTFPYPEQEWKAVRDEIYQDIYHNFWNEEKKAWVQYKGSSGVDASALLMPLTHFIAPTEPRWLSTMKVIDEDLRLDVLIYRYRNHLEKVDGLDGEEGTFNMCSFWFIEALAKSGEVDRAVENFEKMMGYANHLGLFSEELGKKGEHLGNFPQAFTHLALISAALELDKQLSRQRGFNL